MQLDGLGEDQKVAVLLNKFEGDELRRDRRGDGAVRGRHQVAPGRGPGTSCASGSNPI